MIDLVKVVVATLVVLAAVAVVVIGGQDSTYFVPPPQAVVENFTREIAARRYDRASILRLGSRRSTYGSAVGNCTRRLETSSKSKASRA